MEFAFVIGLAREEMITKLVKGGSTNACCSNEGRGNNWEVKVMEEGEWVGGVV
jgi:hypothetical protein